MHSPLTSAVPGAVEPAVIKWALLHGVYYQVMHTQGEEGGRESRFEFTTDANDEAMLVATSSVKGGEYVKRYTLRTDEEGEEAPGVLLLKEVGWWQCRGFLEILVLKTVEEAGAERYSELLLGTRDRKMLWLLSVVKPPSPSEAQHIRHGVWYTNRMSVLEQLRAAGRRMGFAELQETPWE